MPTLAVGAALGAALAYFFDRQNGKRRRHMTRDRAVGLLRGSGRRATRAGRLVASEAYGVKQKATHLREEPKDFDDATLTNKVETEVFRSADVPKGNVNVNVQNGVVQLRGEVTTPEMVEVLVEKTRKVQGVQAVENLLHLPGAPAPMHE
jgi:osmotically-inducible protein OsmY